MKPERPALRYHGGKWRLAPWILGHFPPHRIYVEPFGGAASVLLQKPRSYAEIYNDLDREVVGYFRALRDPAARARLVELLRLTPFARAEFAGAYEDTDDELERARRLVIRSFMGFGSDGCNSDVSTGFRASSHRSHTTPALDWKNLPDHVDLVGARFAGVVIEHRDALEVMSQHDGAETLHYVDPPYLPATRSKKSRRTGERYHAYRHEMDAVDHDALLAFLLELEGFVVLSGYPSPTYDAALRGWRRAERVALADGARERTEVLWINPRAAAALEHAAGSFGLFAQSPNRATIAETETT